MERGEFMKHAAIVGCGNIAEIHANALSQLPGINITAVADVDITKAGHLSYKYTDNTAKVYKNITVMLSSEDINVLHICTPHYLHVPMAVEGLKSGKDIFMEKPPAISLKEFEYLKETVKKSNHHIGFCFQNRYNQAVMALDTIVESKSLGSLIGSRAFVTWRRDKAYYSDGWHGILSKEGGGVLINQSIHTLDLMLRYLGTPKVITASMNNHHLSGITEVEDTLEAWMEFADGKRACFYASNAYANDAPVILELTFDDGWVTMTGNTLTIFKNGTSPKVQTFNPESRNSIGRSYWGTSHLACIEDFYSHLSDSTGYQNDITGIENTMKTVIRIYEAAGKQY